MKVYTFFSESHRPILNQYFLKTFPFESGLELSIRYISQDCRTGSFLDDGWTAAMKKKVEYVIDSIEESKGKDEYFVHSDCDIIFFNHIKKDLQEQIKGHEIACINDIQMLCAGFFIARANDRILKLFQNIRGHLNMFANGSGGADQLAMNFFIGEMGIKAKALDFRYHNIFHSIQQEWTSEIDFQIPPDIIMHHANFTRGVSTKIKLLDLISDKVQNEDFTTDAGAQG